ncbi:hypothetical protein NE237_008015 [Protea cynaroides]|uniref:Pentatricopeptide repeat-containing protein n=1 Tax=Protea cynaroides TaxID=273540 RepID=A0A9Q0KRB2_9MAGN|nr:hypothetical protein NE237_008015 [Protea cynaroides]
MKLLGRLQRCGLRIQKSRLHWRSFFTDTTFEQQLKTLDMDRTIASVHSISSNPCFSLLGLCKTIGCLKKIHGLLIVHGLTDDLLCQTKFVSLYGFFGDIKCARSVFDQIREPDLYSWKVMIRWYFLNDSYPELLRLYTRMRQCLKENDNVVFSVVLKACSELHELDEGRKLHCQIVKVGNPDSFVLTGLVDMYAKCGEIGCSRAVFEEISDRNVVSWTSMIVGYVQNDCPQEALVLFNRMRQGMIDANQVTMGSLLTACTKLGALYQGKWVHGFIIKEGIIMNPFLVSALLNMYVKCGMISDARATFDELPMVDLVSWTTMIVGYTQRNLLDEALKLFTDKKWASLLPNSVTVASILSACGQSGNSNLGRSVHGIGIKLGLEDGPVRNGLIDMYAKCHMIRDAHYIFQTVSDKDVIAWNSMITGYSQNGSAYEALILFHQMRLDFITPDAVTVVGILSACACMGALHLGCSLHAYAIKEGFLLSNVRLGTALLNFYAKCGDAGSARKVFDGMEEKNTVTWSAMMGGYGMHGDASESLALFSEMLNENMEPNEVIFTSILSACSHTGMVGEGWRYFDSMCQEYQVVPSMKHYVCMVDLLARAGRIEEALAFIEAMPVQPDASVFGALLHGCRLHSRLDLGELGVKNMLELQPDSAGYYVLISNFYASDGRWNKVNEVRELMKHKGLSKSPGCSLLEMDNGNRFSALRVASLP